MEDEKVFSIENNELVIRGTPSEVRADFFKAMEERVELLDESDYQKQTDSFGLASFRGDVYQSVDGETKFLSKPRILVNKSVFVQEDDDYSDLIPVVVRHEVAETWVYSKKGLAMTSESTTISKEKRKELAHQYARRKEWEYAFEIGKADRHLEFMTKYIAGTEQTRLEFQSSYERAKKKYLSKIE